MWKGNKLVANWTKIEEVGFMRRGNVGFALVEEKIVVIR